VPGTVSITVAICTHNPNPEILRRCLAAVRAQRNVPSQTELIIVDNGSRTPVTMSSEFATLPSFTDTRVVREETLGLTHARHRALQEATGEIVVFVDDDNFLAPDYLAVIARFFADHPEAGAVGGRCLGVYENPPPSWIGSVAAYLAISDQGDQAFHMSQPDWWAPVGAGMAVRRQAALQAFNRPMLLTDRLGKSLSSGGDTEICYRICRAGHQLWYVPALTLEHFMPAWRTEPAYLLKLAKGIGRSQAILEIYRLPDERRGPLLALRRAIYFARQGLVYKWRAWRATEEGERISAQIQATHLLSQAGALFGLCFHLPRV
jgi:GT2 family glycosyltransferase